MAENDVKMLTISTYFLIILWQLTRFQWRCQKFWNTPNNHFVPHLLVVLDDSQGILNCIKHHTMPYYCIIRQRRRKLWTKHVEACKDMYTHTCSILSANPMSCSRSCGTPTSNKQLFEWTVTRCCSFPPSPCLLSSGNTNRLHAE